MVEFVDEAVGVETRLRQDGMAVPNAFLWRGRRYQITSWGRESATMCDVRACCCHLFQTDGLVGWGMGQDLTTGGWTLFPRWPRKQRVF
jgi:hypothetical protein